MSSAADTAALPPLEGSVEPRGSLADFIWFRSGGPAEWLARPKDEADLARFLEQLDADVPVTPIGVGTGGVASA